MTELEKLLADVPLHEDESDPARREVAMRNVRLSIATRWAYILDLKSKVDEAHYSIMVERMKSSMTTLLELHGPEIPFCLDPYEKRVVAAASDTPLECPVTDTSGTSTTRSSSSTEVIPHEFKFLPVQDVGGSAVWTCVKVQIVEKVSMNDLNTPTII